MFNFLSLSCLLAVAASSVVAYGAHPSLDHITFPSYKFKYAVHEPHTGDSKSHWESRFGDSVKGSYSLLEPDGRIRVVDYTADDHNGFNAVVKHIGTQIHPSALPISPVVHIPPAPIAAPVAHPLVLIPPWFHGAVSTAHTVHFPESSYPILKTSIAPVWGLQTIHPAELPLQAGHGGIPWSDEAPKAKEPEVEEAPAPSPVFTVRSSRYGHDGKLTWSTGPIPFVEGNKVIFRHKY